MPKLRTNAEIALVIAFKLAAMAVLFLLFFAPSKRPRLDNTAVYQHLLSPSGGSKP